MENFNLGKENSQKDESVLNKASNLVKAKVLSTLLNNSKLDKNLANNLYANRILEEERVAPDKSFFGIIPSLPEEAKIINVSGSTYVNIGDKMYYVRDFQTGFDLVDNTSDFIPIEHLGSSENKRRTALQKKYGLSSATEAVPRNEFYRFDESISDLDDWIIHNDKGEIRKDDRSGTYKTWWKKGEPYKGIIKRSLVKDNPHGRHLFAKQSALEASIGRPLDQHRELMGDVTRKGNVESGGLTITPTSEADLPKIEGLKSITYNPITKSMERGIFHDSEKPNNEEGEDKNTELYRENDKR